MVRLFYCILWVTLQYVLRIFYRQVKTVNSPKEIFGRTIYVSNHAASFMDPLVVASQRLPIVFFMTRSDVFTPLSKPLLWSAHMLPIYRQHDGEDTKAKNEAVFQKCVRILNWGRNLLIFGEGFTDDVFVRRLKPIKKGAARIGFQTLESLHWKKKVYISAVGVNYTDPNRMRSDVLIATSDKFCLNDYKEQYLANPSKTITEVTKRIEQLMQDQITHVEDLEMTEVHESAQMLLRNGMHPTAFDRHLNLEIRWKNSQELAQKLNALAHSKKEQLLAFASRVKLYLNDLKNLGITEEDVVEFSEKNQLQTTKHLLASIALFPFAILGILHGYLPYFFIKKFVEKSFRRKVFWGSVKMLLGYIVMGLINLPVPYLFAEFIYPSIAWGWVYYLMIGLFFLSFIQCKYHWTEFHRKKSISSDDLQGQCQRRESLMKDLSEILPA